VARAPRYPVTRAIHVLRENHVAFEPHLYTYVESGGTRASSAALGIDEHHVIKTLIFEDDETTPLVVLMHGDREVAVKSLARAAGAKRTTPCNKATADRHSGYQVGGTSPFGTRQVMPVFMQSSILQIERIAINGGSRGFLVTLSPQELVRVLRPTLVDVAAPKGGS
jgi:Cys-tRNA(Pro) deacylase